VLLDAAHDVRLGHVIGVDQHQRQGFVGILRAALANDARLLGVELAGLVQHVRQMAVLLAHRGQDQPAFAESSGGALFARHDLAPLVPRAVRDHLVRLNRGVDAQGARLARQADQVEDLGSAEIGQISFERH